MSKIYVDGKACEADAKQNLLHACLSLGLNLEYFCWHPALGSVGACRQCAVKLFQDEDDKNGKIVMACMTPASDGVRIAIEDPEAKEFRKAVIEGLMLNHPHDCPVCDEGGECHLQDMTMMAGHNYRSYEFPKRTFRNQYLGPFIHHEMNRCIQCYRCVRYYREYAGGDDLNAFMLNDTVFFGRQEDGVLENEFSGNLVEVCPTGVFTDKTLRRHYTRKWDLQMAPSICVHCGLGCNTSPGERYGVLRRIVNRYNGEVNGYFLCDRGRFGYEFVNGVGRIREPLLRGETEPQKISKEEALARLADLVSKKRVLGIGSPRASLEANFALRKLVGEKNFFAGVADREWRLIAAAQRILQRGPARAASLRDVERSDAVLILGEDVTNAAPRMALSLRQSIRQQPMHIAEKLNIPLFLDHAVREAVQGEKGPLFIATPYATRLDDAAAETFRGAPEDLARLGFAVAHVLDSDAPPVPHLQDSERLLAERIAGALRGAERPLVIAGPSCGSEPLIEAAASVATALCRKGHSAKLSFTTPECNSFGLGLMGCASLDEALRAVRQESVDTLVILENDLYRRAPAARVDALFGGVGNVVVLDHVRHATAMKAALVLPASTFAEGDGSLVNNEGRAQRFFQALLPAGDIQESWRWLQEGMAAAGRSEARWQTLDEVIAALERELPALKGVAEVAPPAASRMANERVPRSPHRYSGRTAMTAHLSVHEQKPPSDPDSALSFSMEGFAGQPPSALIPFFWAPGWNSIQATNKFQSEIAGPLRHGDPGIRLIEPQANQTGEPGAYYGDIPAAFQPRAGEWLLVARHHIFGSEELSSSSPAVAELAPQPYVALNPDDAARLQVGEGEEVEVSLDGATHRLPVKIGLSLPVGIAALPSGLASKGSDLPAWGKILSGS